MIISRALLWTLCACADIGGAEEPHKYVYKQSDHPFSFEIVRSGAGPEERPEPIWNTTGHRLIFKEQYLEITSSAPASSTMYGLGERISSSGERFCPACMVVLSQGLSRHQGSIWVAWKAALVMQAFQGASFKTELWICKLCDALPRKAELQQ